MVLSSIVKARWEIMVYVSKEVFICPMGVYMKGFCDYQVLFDQLIDTNPPTAILYSIVFCMKC